ncbi:aldehyde dehydrogenase [Linderina pennispora]|uniref:Succinate-semialdehyde dehydrogenase, mitochondrial n=1 Tax=Linderina pennispora TaxID=61395 RepID=A0A1Y1WBB2_9FUNG|nr:aldehyde dehydrogenase [Linderina pennispora]ORX70813.1 aldehyde dehydrogenase [Linderina pennispora]
MVGNTVIPTTLTSLAELDKVSDKTLIRSLAYVDGKWVSGASQQMFAVLDPATQQEIGRLPNMDAADTRAAIEAATTAFESWRKTTAKERSLLLQKWYQLIIENREDLARIMTLEGGKAFGEITYGASFIEFFAEEAKRAYGDVIPSPLRNSRMLVTKQPVGVVGIITPYNFPNAMITRKAGAALAAGCTVVVRPAHETPFSALALCELAERAGIPKGVINMVTAESTTPEVGLELTTNAAVRKVSFTGSTAVGKLLMGQASGTMKKVSMELGGNAPFIVFEDADLDVAAEQLLACKFRNSGQTCVCANRIYVHESVYDAFVAKFTKLVSDRLKIGHGLSADVNFGPLITECGLAKVEAQLARALQSGGEVVLGGHRVEALAPGRFGPLCPIFSFSSEDEVVRRANSVEVGLAGYFFSRDVGRIFRVADELQVGMVGVNTGIISTEVAPFGGVKESGVGREGSRYGLDEYLNIKYINLAF